MNSASMAPYIGNDSYITLLSCDEDFSLIQKVIGKAYFDGYRIWYNDEDLPANKLIEVFEKNIDQSEICIALITENSVNSHAFRSALTYAVRKGKPVISVFSENTALTVGMRLQISTTTVIEKYMLSGDEYYSRLTDPKEVRKCRDVSVEKPKTMWLERESNRDIVVLKNGATTFGRLSSMCDYAIPDNKYIGRIHATILNTGKSCVVIDNNSKNKTFVNMRVMAPGQQFRIEDGDTVTFADEKFIFHIS